MRRILRLLSCLSVLLAASCLQAPQYRPWSYADLRLLDPADAVSPAADILAVYTRTTPLSVGIRVDLLDISPADNYTVEAYLFDNRDYREAPLVISIPAYGPPRMYWRAGGQAAFRPSVTRNYLLDAITINLNRALIGDRFRVDVFAYSGDSDSPADEACDIRSDSLPPGSRAPLLLEFWDAFPAVTPAQALRRWDGAHTGPPGGVTA